MGVTWLHVSDFHVRGGDPYDRDVVLKALVDSVAEYRERGRRPDLIFATGDIAHAGKAAEYEIAGKFFDDLLRAAGIEKSRLFVIPGNHDVDRDAGVGLARTLDSREQADTYFRPDRTHPHLTLKLRAFLDGTTATSTAFGAAGEYDVLGGAAGGAERSSAGDSSHEQRAVLPGRRRPRQALDRTAVSGSCAGRVEEARRGLNIALMHHPLEWLNPIEGGNIQAEIEASVDILLRGHLHETRLESVASAEGELLRCAAGAAYQSRKWPNRALYGRLDGGELTVFPIRYEDSPLPVWTTDPSVFPRDPNHERRFSIRRSECAGGSPGTTGTTSRRAHASAVMSESRGNRPFVGRDDLIAAIAGTFGAAAAECVVVLHGPPGVGKSELAREFARQHRDRYPGGTFWVDASTDAIAIHLGRHRQEHSGPPLPVRPAAE